MSTRVNRTIRGILEDAVRTSGEVRLRRRLGEFLKIVATTLRGRLAEEARSLRHELGE